MRMAYFILSLFSIMLCAGTAKAQRPIVRSTAINFDGSAPPITSIYTCVQELKGRPYSENETLKCLDQIKASNYFESAKATPHSLDRKSIRLEFHLKAPVLKIVELEYELNEKDRDALQAYLDSKAASVRIGEIYDSDAQGMILQRMQQFFASQERHVGISSKVALDYRARTARLHFRFLEGPTGPKESRFLVKNSGCKDEMQELNLTDVDDYVPLPLVENLIQLRAFSCFAPSLARQDEAALKNTGLFHSVRFDIHGPRGARKVRIEIRGKPLTVTRVNVAAYGLAQTEMLDNLGELPLKANETYKASVAFRTVDYLARLYAHPGRKIDVLQDVKQVGEGNVEVIFSVLVYDDDELQIDGQIIRNASDSKVTGH